MARRPALVTVLVAALAALLLLAGAAAGDPGQDKQRVDSELEALRRTLEEEERRQGVLTSEISAASERVREVEAQVAAEQSRLSSLEERLAGHELRLARLTELVRSQTAQVRSLEREHDTAVEVLERRVREIYMSETPDAFSFVLGASSFADLIDNVELLNDIGRQDADIARRVAKAELRMREARRRTARTRIDVVRTTRRIAAEVAQQRAVRDRLVASRDELAAAVGEKERTLAVLQAEHHEHEEELDVLAAESAALAEQIRAAQEAAAAAAAAATAAAAPPQPQSASPSSPPPPPPPVSSGSGSSSSGFIFPVSGPVVSGFGPRGGRMHEGIDIIAAQGTPVVASAAGTVIRSDWGDGYGNVVVIDHGNGLSTTYAHNSSLAVSVGQFVEQGQVISYVGSTGNSSGPHVHLEFRINGVAVDPFRYL